MSQSNVYVRLKPYNPKGGQSRLVSNLSNLGITFHAGKYIPVPRKLWDNYLKDEYSKYAPYGALYEMCESEGEARAQERREKSGQRRAAQPRRQRATTAAQAPPQPQPQLHSLQDEDEVIDDPSTSDEMDEMWDNLSKELNQEEGSPEFDENAGDDGSLPVDGEEENESVESSESTAEDQNSEESDQEKPEETSKSRRGRKPRNKK